MKKILVSAGTGIAVAVMDRLETGLKKRGLQNQYSITKCKVVELAKKAPEFDVVIRTAMMPDPIDKPVINGIGLAMGGAAAETVLDEVAAAVKG
jgi:PTS system galactitol-specific IIB component